MGRFCAVLVSIPAKNAIRVFLVGEKAEASARETFLKSFPTADSDQIDVKEINWPDGNESPVLTGEVVSWLPSRADI